jgi:ribosomal protein S8
MYSSGVEHWIFNPLVLGSIPNAFIFIVWVAQMVEQRTENPWVSSSILLLNKKIKTIMKLFCNLIVQLKMSFKSHQKYIILPKNIFYLKFLKILFLEGFISRIVFINSQNKIKIYLKYNSDGASTFKEIKILSSSSKNLYLSYKQLTKLTHGLGVFFISTNKGLLSHHSCLKLKIGGTALCYII